VIEGDFITGDTEREFSCMGDQTKASAKHWCFTLNNYDITEQEKVQQLGQHRDVAYLIIGREKGEKGTPHLQGYIAFHKRKRFSQTKGLISDRAHLEKANGSPIQNREYCSKGGDFDEYGVIPKGQGSRTDLSSVVKDIEDGATLQEIAKKHPAATLRYGNGIQRLRMFIRPRRETPPEIWTLWGKTGTGKTRRVWEFADVDKLWVHPGDRWFDGYDGQPAVLFDDFDGSWFKLSYLLKLLDRYIFQVPVKGGYTWWKPKVIYITSNLNPKEWYPAAHQEHQRALIRRIEEFGHIQECFKY
jgi:hypothetical protein